MEGCLDNQDVEFDGVLPRMAEYLAAGGRALPHAGAEHLLFGVRDHG